MAKRYFNKDDFSLWAEFSDFTMMGWEQGGLTKKRFNIIRDYLFDLAISEPDIDAECDLGEYQFIVRAWSYNGKVNVDFFIYRGLLKPALFTKGYTDIYNWLSK